MALQSDSESPVGHGFGSRIQKKTVFHYILMLADVLTLVLIQDSGLVISRRSNLGFVEGPLKPNQKKTIWKSKHLSLWYLGVCIGCVFVIWGCIWYFGRVNWYFFLKEDSFFAKLKG